MKGAGKKRSKLRKQTLEKNRFSVFKYCFEVISPFYKVMTGVNPSAEEFEHVLKELTVFDKELASRGSSFFGGDKPGMVDYMIWPWFERIEMFKVLYGDQYVISEQRLPNLTKWVNAMKLDDAVKQYYLTPEQHARFMRTHQAGSPDFDILTQE